MPIAPPAPWRSAALAWLLAWSLGAGAAGTARAEGIIAPQPLYRDPVYDGAADPTVIWNAGERHWYMLYTNRRANVPGLNGVAWVHGTAIGIATSVDGAHWNYRGTASLDFPGEVRDPTWWAPAVVAARGRFHLFVSYVPGTFADGWNHPRDIWHFEGGDLVHWKYVSTLPLSSHRVIDPGILHLPDGTWRLWYKDEADHSSCHVARSPDLAEWSDAGRVPGLSDVGGEAPLPFHWRGYYWLLRDVTGGKHGLAVYRSTDAAAWIRTGTLLQEPGRGPDDRAVGHHPEVILGPGHAYLFYFTHPAAGGGSAGENAARRSSIQVVELNYDSATATLTADRNAPTSVVLSPPADPATQSKYQE